jgi:hypothetical protein
MKRMDDMNKTTGRVKIVDDSGWGCRNCDATGSTFIDIAEDRRR